MTSDDEIIGFVRRATLEARELITQGFRADPEARAYALIRAGLEWGARSPLELDPSRKQIIPYVALCRGDELWVMRRRRAGREARLHDRLSIGVGGHLERTEGASSDPIRAGMARELAEELELSAPLASIEYAGLITDETNEVGRVHLGLAFVAEVAAQTDVAIAEPDKMHGEWMTRAALRARADQLETWSAIFLSHLDTQRGFAT